MPVGIVLIENYALLLNGKRDRGEVQERRKQKEKERDQLLRGRILSTARAGLIRMKFRRGPKQDKAETDIGGQKCAQKIAANLNC